MLASVQRALHFLKRAVERLRPASRGLWRTAVPLVVVTVPVGTAAGFEWVRRPPPPSDAPKPRRAPRFDRTFDARRFLKGNIHTHTDHSDGDAAPEDVIAWYRRQGYAFVAITDHNRLTDAKSYPALQDDTFQLVNGEEVTMKGGNKQVHVNALCTKSKIGGGTFPSAADALAWATTRIASQGGVAVVNHPNFDRALQETDLLAAGAASALEVMSGHPYVYSRGVAGRPSHEAMWDFALSAGARFMGVAVDDLHHLRVDADPPAYAGRGWVQIFGEHDDPAAICDALRQGLLYSSSGASLSRIAVTETTYMVWPTEVGATVRFIGRDGRLLQTDGPLAAGRRAAYALRAGDGYVRARITDTDGSTAWTPAVFEAH